MARAKQHTLSFIVLLALASGCSCDDAEPPVGLTDASGGSDGGTSNDATTGQDTGPNLTDTGTTTGGQDGGPGADASTADTGLADTGPTPECQAPADCQALFGAPPCGMWECNAMLCDVSCPNCTGDADGDGYGTGAGCAGLDCDDTNDMVFDTDMRACYSGSGGARNVGACRPGVETCSQGVWSACTGEVTPSAEACNNEDDDCNMMVDDGLGSFTCGLGACQTTAAACQAGQITNCVPAAPLAANDTTCDGVDDDCDGVADEDCGAPCVLVANNGDDTQADADDNATPFATIQAAISWSDADNARPKTVCVAPGSACGDNFTFNGAITMEDGISVLGGYESTNWTRCTNSNTVIQTGTPEGVLFPSSINSPTILDGFRVNRFMAVTTAAITVDGARQVTLSNLRIENTPAATTSIGINIENGAEALITRSSIYAGNGTSESYGIRSVDSTPTIRENCNSLDNIGHCDDFCGTSNLGIRGRFTQGTGDTAGILLENSPGAIVDSNAICGVDADVGAGVWILGDAAGTLVRANLINAWGGLMDSHGVWIGDCDGEAPRIADNHLIAAAGDLPSTRVDGVRAVGDCHPVIENNELITGGGEGGTTGANGVLCGSDGNTASRCVVLSNQLIQGSEFGFPPTAVGVRCEDDGCNRIAGNVITGHGGQNVWGVVVENSGVVIERNDISGGCGETSATGVRLEGSFATLENNFINAGFCPNGGPTSTIFAGLHVLLDDSGNEPVIHSNTIDGRGRGGACASTGIAMGIRVANPPSNGGGVVMNNIIRGGNCGNNAAFVELDAASDPRIFHNNDLDPSTTPNALYFDEFMTALSSTAAINGLTDTNASGNISVDPLFVGYPGDMHIDSGSMCIDAGATRGAPAIDFDGDLRDAMPDIGADEH